MESIAERFQKSEFQVLEERMGSGDKGRRCWREASVEGDRGNGRVRRCLPTCSLSTWLKLGARAPSGSPTGAVRAAARGPPSAVSPGTQEGRWMVSPTAAGTGMRGQLCTQLLSSQCHRAGSPHHTSLRFWSLTQHSTTQHNTTQHYMMHSHLCHLYMYSCHIISYYLLFRWEENAQSHPLFHSIKLSLKMWYYWNWMGKQREKLGILSEFKIWLLFKRQSGGFLASGILSHGYKSQLPFIKWLDFTYSLNCSRSRPSGARANCRNLPGFTKQCFLLRAVTTHRGKQQEYSHFMTRRGYLKAQFAERNAG